MHDDGVHPGSHEEGVDGVGFHAGTLSDGSGHDGARGGSELRTHRNRTLSAYFSQ